MTAWRPAGHGAGSWNAPGYPPGYPQGGMGYPGHSGPMGYPGYSGPMAYPGMMGGYPGYAGVATPVGMPFERGRPGSSPPPSPESWRGGPDRRSRGNSGEDRERRSAWAPPAQVLERDGALIVRLELPGLERKDVDVRVEDQSLVVEGERPDDRPEGEFEPKRWGYGPFRREIDLPHPVDAGDVKARFRNGLMEVVVPQPRREDRRRRIKIEA